MSVVEIDRDEARTLDAENAAPWWERRYGADCPAPWEVEA